VGESNNRSMKQLIAISLQSVLNAHVRRPSLTVGKASMLEIGPSPQLEDPLY
jgi:hypothetical protein